MTEPSSTASGSLAPLAESIPPAGPTNAFYDDFLRQLGEEDDPPLAALAEGGGSWVVRRIPEGYGIFRYWEIPAHGDLPRAVFRDAGTARVAAAVIPTTTSIGPYELADERRPDGGFEIACNGEACGVMATFDEPFLTALNFAHDLLTRPDALAQVLLAAGPTALELVGRCLRRATADSASSQPAS